MLRQRPLLALDLCRRKGFAAVERDNVDGYSDRNGFPQRPALGPWRQTCPV